jgi:hypothetical protein
MADTLSDMSNHRFNAIGKVDFIAHCLSIIYSWVQITMNTYVSLKSTLSQFEQTIEQTVKHLAGTINDLERIKMSIPVLTSREVQSAQNKLQNIIQSIVGTNIIQSIVGTNIIQSIVGTNIVKTNPDKYTDATRRSAYQGLRDFDSLIQSSDYISANNYSHIFDYLHRDENQHLMAFFPSIQKLAATRVNPQKYIVDLRVESLYTEMVELENNLKIFYDTTTCDHQSSIYVGDFKTAKNCDCTNSNIYSYKWDVEDIPQYLMDVGDRDILVCFPNVDKFYEDLSCYEYQLTDSNFHTLYANLSRLY